MTLFINTSSSETQIALMKEGKVLALETWESKMNESDKILPAITDLLSKQKLEVNNLTKIMVLVGPGSFTGIRVGVSVANTLAKSLEIPVLSITNPQLAAYRLNTQEDLNKIFVHWQLNKSDYFKQNAADASSGKREGEIVHLKGVDDLQVVFSATIPDFQPEIRILEEALLALDEEFAGTKEIAQPFYVVPPAISKRKKL